MKKNLIIHGHFYQPPRENPWTGLIDRQPSAGDFHDWNERITAECYAANAYSRRLNSDGRISEICNNYSSISFNFGPTLMNWLRLNHNSVYHRIQEADKESMEKWGHGNAVAQVYNHIIMPLADEHDQITQILWGIEDFKFHFNRAPEGMWLAETAINALTAELLVRCGIKYTILSPFQAKEYREGSAWKDLEGKGAPCDRAFNLKTEAGDLAVFFYHGELASGISFNHYLHSADKLLEILLEKSKDAPGKLLNIATDGEIYGHHEPFGDMCLAALISKLENHAGIELTNYGRFLKENPPEQEIRLHEGEEAKGTSWSCSHGVSRWFKDCGCHTGGGENWNQRWRGPLRDAFDSLSKRLKTEFSSTLEKLSNNDSWNIRNEYIQVLLGLTGKQDFAQKHLQSDTEENRLELYRQLEAQKYALYMYTSCGWFFSELSGIEPVQNIRYALKAIEVFDKEQAEILTDLLAADLEKAPSNLQQWQNGRIVLEKLARPSNDILPNIAASFLISDFYHQPLRSYGLYRNTGISTVPVQTRLKEGWINIVDSENLKVYNLEFSLSIPKNKAFPLLKISTEDGVFERSVEDLPEDLRNLLFAENNSVTDWDVISNIRYEDQEELHRAGMLLNCLPEGLEKDNIIHYLNILLNKTANDLQYRKINKVTLGLFRKLLIELKLYKYLFNRKDIEISLKKTIHKLILRFINSKESPVYDIIIHLLDISHKSQLDFICPECQNAVYNVLNDKSFQEEARLYQNQVINTAELLNINTSDILDLEVFEEL